MGCCISVSLKSNIGYGMLCLVLNCLHVWDSARSVDEEWFSNEVWSVGKLTKEILILLRRSSNSYVVVYSVPKRLVIHPRK